MERYIKILESQGFWNFMISVVGLISTIYGYKVIRKKSKSKEYISLKKKENERR